MKVKYERLEIQKGNKTYFYVCTCAKYNLFLERYYPCAELSLIIEHLNDVELLEEELK